MSLRARPSRVFETLNSQDKSKSWYYLPRNCIWGKKCKISEERLDVTIYGWKLSWKLQNDKTSTLTSAKNQSYKSSALVFECSAIHIAHTSSFQPFSTGTLLAQRRSFTPLPKTITPPKAATAPRRFKFTDASEQSNISKEQHMFGIAEQPGKRRGRVSLERFSSRDLLLFQRIVRCRFVE